MKSNTRFLYLFLLFWSNAIIALPNTIDEFRKISENGKIGLENISTKQIVIPPTFDDIGWSNETSDLVIDGIIGFKLNNKWGLINLEGNRVIKEQYTVLYPFINNLIVVGKRSKTSILYEYGVINSSGKSILELEYQRLEVNNKYLLASKSIGGKLQTGLLSASLKTIIPFEYKSIEPIDSNLYTVKNDKDLTALFDVNEGQKSEFNFESINALDDKYLLISLNNRTGIIDREGNIIADPIYKEIKVENDKIVGTPFPKWSFLNSNNKTLNSFYFDQVYTLSNSAFIVQTNDKVSIINEEGAYLSYFHDLHITEVNYGLAIVQREDYFGVLDMYGNIVIPINQDAIWLDEGFIFTKINKSDGHSWTPYNHSGKRIGYFGYQEFERINDQRLRAKRNQKWGLLNNSGIEVSPFSFDSLGAFNNGFSSVHYLDMFGVIDENGRWVLTPHKDEITVLQNHFLYRFGSEKGLITHSGEVIFRSQNEILQLGEFFTVKNRDDKYILLNQEGNRAILEPVDTVYYAEPSLYIYQNNDQWHMLNASNMRVTKLKKNIQQISIMSEGLIMAEIDDHWGFLKDDGQLSIANRYDSLQFYSEGLAAVQLIGKWGFIDPEEKIVIQPNYEYATPFKGHLSIIKKDGHFGMINNIGTIVLEAKYDKIEQTEDYILLFKDELIGLANGKGDLLRNIQFSSIEAIDQGHFLVSKNGKYGIISNKGLDIIPTTYDKVISFKDKFLVKEKLAITSIDIN
jgi:WG repeat protein